jgi:hypothetical protein
LMVLTLEKVPDSNAHDDHEDQDYELSIHELSIQASAIVAQSSEIALSTSHHFGSTSSHTALIASIAQSRSHLTVLVGFAFYHRSRRRIAL